MNNNVILSQISELVGRKNAFAVCLPENPLPDTIASGITLYLALAKLGKNVSLACASDIESHLIGADKIQKNLTAAGDNLIISFPYIEGAIDKVTYNIEGNYFNLLIQPREGGEKLDPSQIKYRYSGGQFDTILTIDAPNLSFLGDVYSANQTLFKGRDIINIDRHLVNANFGSINIVEKQTSSTAEIILSLLRNLGVEIDVDMATNLYAGIIAATNNFTAYSVSAQTFEASAFLLKAGAVKKVISRQKPKRSVNDFSFPDDTQVGEESQTAIKTAEIKEPRRQEETPKDWLRPKIFKGSTMV